MAEVTNSSLLERLGLPEDLRWLAEKYPRENWQG
ncbi:hemerythrin domain-containing protein, partial [Mesorhizobium sp. M8A.F.Ca.ET.023.01.1.1]